MATASTSIQRNQRFKQAVKSVIKKKGYLTINKKDFDIRNKTLYPRLEKIIQWNCTNIIRARDEVSECVEIAPFALFCVKKLTEKYISRYNAPSDEWPLIGYSALFLVWKAYGLDELGLLEMRDLIDLSDRSFTAQQMKDMEITLLKMEDYVVCGGGL